MDITPHSRIKLWQGQKGVPGYMESSLSDDEDLMFEVRPRKPLRQSAFAPRSQSMAGSPESVHLRHSALTSGSAQAQAITTMENADVEAMVVAIGAVIRAYTRDTASKKKSLTGPNSQFDELAHPLDASGQWRYIPKEHTIEAFVRTIQVALELDESSVVIALILLERAMQTDHGLVVSARTWRPALLMAIVIASKVVYDEKVFLADYREQLPELCLTAASSQEVAFLELIKFNTIVRRGQYAKYYYALEDVHRKQTKQAGRRSPSPI